MGDKQEMFWRMYGYTSKRHETRPGTRRGLALLALYMLQCGMTRPGERVGVDIVNETQAD